MTDVELMRRALFHAARAAGATAPIRWWVPSSCRRDGIIVGQGRHPKAGEAHAEVFALDQAGERARGGTLYVTLEPCCHFGRTAPCTTRVIASGVTRVVVAMKDPNPAGERAGDRRTARSRIAVEVGLLEEEARRLNRAFVTVQTLGTAGGDREGGDQRRRVHRGAPGVNARRSPRRRRTAACSACARWWTRSRSARGRVLADDPLLTVRDRSGPGRSSGRCSIGGSGRRRPPGCSRPSPPGR